MTKKSTEEEATEKDSKVGFKRLTRYRGYFVDNIQWVHKHINIMKQWYKQEYFIGLCKLIAERNK